MVYNKCHLKSCQKKSYKSQMIKLYLIIIFWFFIHYLIYIHRGMIILESTVSHIVRFISVSIRSYLMHILVLLKFFCII